MHAMQSTYAHKHTHTHAHLHTNILTDARTKQTYRHKHSCIQTCTRIQALQAKENADIKAQLKNRVGRISAYKLSNSNGAAPAAAGIMIADKCACLYLWAYGHK